MKSHFCKAEGTMLDYEDECNWCGEKEITSKLEQAARQALEALEELHYSSGTVVAARMYEIATAALREALSEQAVEPEQEPVYAFRRKGLNSFCTCDKERYEELADKPNLFEVTTLYAAPVRTKDLTDDEIEAIHGCPPAEWVRSFARAVIAADREKNK